MVQAQWLSNLHLALLSTDHSRMQHNSLPAVLQRFSSFSVFEMTVTVPRISESGRILLIGTLVVKRAGCKLKGTTISPCDMETLFFADMSGHEVHEGFLTAAPSKSPCFHSFLWSVICFTISSRHPKEWESLRSCVMDALVTIGFPKGSGIRVKSLDKHDVPNACGTDERRG